jgi:RNA polymerase sigma factor (sigma-70 family)
MEELKDYHVTITVRNNYLLQAMRKKGFLTAASLAMAAGVWASVVSDYLSLKLSPVLKNGEWRESIQKIGNILGALPENLFPSQHIRLALGKNKAAIEMGAAEIEFLLENRHSANPELKLIERDAAKAIENALETLSPREQKIIRAVFGLDGEQESCAQLGRKSGVCRETIHNIEQRALGKLRKGSAIKYLDGHLQAIEAGKYLSRGK